MVVWTHSITVTQAEEGKGKRDEDMHTYCCFNRFLALQNPRFLFLLNVGFPFFLFFLFLIFLISHSCPSALLPFLHYVFFPQLLVHGEHLYQGLISLPFLYFWPQSISLNRSSIFIKENMCLTEIYPCAWTTRIPQWIHTQSIWIILWLFHNHIHTQTMYATITVDSMWIKLSIANPS